MSEDKPASRLRGLSALNDMRQHTKNLPPPTKEGPRSTNRVIIGIPAPPRKSRQKEVTETWLKGFKKMLAGLIRRASTDELTINSNSENEKREEEEMKQKTTRTTKQLKQAKPTITPAPAPAYQEKQAKTADRAATAPTLKAKERPELNQPPPPATAMTKDPVVESAETPASDLLTQTLTTEVSDLVIGASKITRTETTANVPTEKAGADEELEETAPIAATTEGQYKTSEKSNVESETEHKGDASKKEDTADAEQLKAANTETEKTVAAAVEAKINAERALAVKAEAAETAKLQAFTEIAALKAANAEAEKTVAAAAKAQAATENALTKMGETAANAQRIAEVEVERLKAEKAEADQKAGVAVKALENALADKMKEIDRLSKLEAEHLAAIAENERQAAVNLRAETAAKAAAQTAIDTARTKKASDDERAEAAETAKQQAAIPPVTPTASVPIQEPAVPTPQVVVVPPSPSNFYALVLGLVCVIALASGWILFAFRDQNVMEEVRKAFEIKSSAEQEKSKVADEMNRARQVQMDAMDELNQMKQEVEGIRRQHNVAPSLLPGSSPVTPPTQPTTPSVVPSTPTPSTSTVTPTPAAVVNNITIVVKRPNEVEVRTERQPIAVPMVHSQIMTSSRNVPYWAPTETGNRYMYNYGPVPQGHVHVPQEGFNGHFYAD